MADTADRDGGRDRNELPATASIVVACVLILFSVVGASAAVLREDLGGAVFASIGFLIGVPYLFVALRARRELHEQRQVPPRPPD